MNSMLAETGEWSGRILDIGGIGSSRPSYIPCLHIADHAVIETVNIDADAKPTMIADASAIPCADNIYDAAWCFNVLEHVSDPGVVLSEACRVLKPGARLLMCTPFLIRVHGHPNDYRRFTEAALRLELEKAGFSIETIKPIHGGPFIAAAHQVQPVLPHILSLINIIWSTGLDRIVGTFRPWTRTAWPLGYLTIARKLK
ncbi:MAG: methyltransferase domain-containing protein [Patescibacteria group bacterium]